MITSDPQIRCLVVVGASARAMAESAARAGWRVHAADLFADLDLRAVTQMAERARPYPDALPSLVARFPPGPWLYGGAVENHPHVIEAIGSARPLAGCQPGAVAAVRDPDTLAALVRAAGLHFPETRRDPAGVPADGSWLTKPLRSAGGHGIAAWRGADAEPPRAADRIWQRRVRGRPWSATYLMAGGSSRLLGTSRQLLGRRWCHAQPFAFCGSVDVAVGALAATVRDHLGRLGGVLAERVGMGGLVGVDLVIDQDDRVHVIEVNPRPTASMELIERATGLSLAAAHMAACGFPAPPAAQTRPRRGTWSKAILYAPRDLRVDDASLAAILTAAGGPHDGWPLVADIPAPLQTLPAGSPVCTLFAHGDSPRQSLAALHRQARAVSRPFAAPTEADRHETASDRHPRSSPGRSP